MSTTATETYMFPNIPSSVIKKRKRDEIIKIPLGDPFTITPCADFEESVHITPAAILPRSCIDLEWLNARSTTTKLFAADIPNIDPPGLVLIAKYDNSLQLAAIERVGEYMYALYRLSTSIKLKQVRSILSAAKRDMSLWPPLNLPTEFPALYDSENWWQEVDYNDNVLFGVLDQACLTPCSGQLRMDNLLRVSKAPTGNFTKIKPISKTRRENVPAALSSKGSESAHEICLSQLLQQYYNLLYTTKSSIQYFPKTSLSRARVVFQTSGESPNSRLDLLLFLENMLVPLEDCDLKYSAGLRMVVDEKQAQTALGAKLSNEELEQAITAPDCFKNGELKYVLKWHKSLQDNENGPVRSLEQEDAYIKKRIKQLRLRETELQILLCLEILAIKSRLSDEKLVEYESLKKAALRKKRRQEKAANKTNGKSKKRRRRVEPATLLDILVDRLCIWHSIGTNFEAKDSQQSSQTKDKDEKDHLRHFCIEIIVAFYSSRIPNICDDIKCKCTGRMKKPHTQQESFEVKAAWSAQVETQAESQDTLEYLNEPQDSLANSASRRPPLLSRSLTAPASASTFERDDHLLSLSFQGESQDLSLEIAAEVSQEKEIMKTSFRGGITTTKKAADRRVVEVSNKAKRQKTDNKYEHVELKDAIRNIAKPNRLAVSEELVSASAQRMKISGRKPKKPIRNPMANVVQVAATPRKNARTAKLLERKAEVPDLIVEEEDAIPSSCQVVLQSSIGAGIKRRSFQVDQIEATPSKAPRLGGPRKALHQQDLHKLNFLPSSPPVVTSTPLPPKRSLTEPFIMSSASKSNIFISETPVKSFRTSTEGISLAKGFMNTISETPTKQAASRRLRPFLPNNLEDEVIGSSPLQRPKPGTPIARKIVPRDLDDVFNESGPSIYEQLGWD